MANPQPTPFVQFSKELFDAVLLSPMPATHKEIVLAVIRRTYGDHGRKSAPISQTLLQQMTGRHTNGIRRSLRELVAEGVIVQVSAPSFGRSAVLRINKDYEQWGKWSVPYIPMEDPQEVGEVQQGVGEEVQQGVGEEVQQGVGEEVQQGVPMEDIDTRDIDTYAPSAKQLKPKTAKPTLDRFREFYDLYPKKKNPGDAEKAWLQMTKATPPEEIIAGLKRLLPTLRATERQFIPYPASWLRGKRWLDEQEQEKTPLQLIDEIWGEGASDED